MHDRNLSRIKHKMREQYNHVKIILNLRIKMEINLKRLVKEYIMLRANFLSLDVISILDKLMQDENLNLGRICFHSDKASELMAMLIIVKNRFVIPFTNMNGKMHFTA